MVAAAQSIMGFINISLRNWRPWLLAFEKRIEREPLVRFAFFSVCTVITIGMLGYHFGTFDQASHIPFLRQMANPSLYPGDEFLTLRFTKYSYFWHLFVPMLKAGVLEYGLFVLYVASVFLTFLAIWELAMVLFASARIATLSSLVMALPHFGFGYFNLFEFSLVNRVVVFPLLLLCMTLYLKKRYVWAWGLAGVLFNFHALTVIFVLIMYGVDTLLRWKEIKMTHIAGSFVAFIVSASPVLLWKFGSSGLMFGPYPDWFHDVNQGLLMHVFSVINVWPPFLFASLNGMLLIAMTFLYIRETDGETPHRIIRNFLIATVVTIVIHTMATIYYPSVFIMQFQLLRISIFSILFFFMYATAHVCRLASGNKKRTPELFLLFALLGSSMTAFLYAVGDWAYRARVFARWGRVLLCVQLVSYMVVLVFLIGRGLYLPQIRIFAPDTPSTDAQLWIKNHTPNDAVIIAPPYLWSLYDADWRVFSERATIVTWSELLELAFIPEYYPGWVERFDSMVPGIRQQFAGHFMDNQARIRSAYISLPPESVRRLADRYTASFFVTEKVREYPYLLMYENAKFRVYDVRVGL